MLKDLRFFGLSVIGNNNGYFTIDPLDTSHQEQLNSKIKLVIQRHLSGSNEQKLNVAIVDSKWIFEDDVVTLLVNSYGYHPKYIASILSSRLIGKWLKDVSSITNERTQISIKTLSSIQIPILSLTDQLPFVKIVDFILNSKEEGAILFFERILDAMHYEIYFPDQIHKNNLEIIKHIHQLPEIGVQDSTTNFQIQEHYKKLSSPNHPLSAALLKLFNIKEVIEIEGII